MGFGRELRRARDSSLPPGRRVMAFTWCVEMTQPIGFHTTLEFLGATVGSPFDRFDALEPALASLVEVRRRHQAIQDTYAEMRRAEKSKGRRTPGLFEATPNDPRRWHGAEVEAALFSLRDWRARHYVEDSLGETEDGRAVLGMVDKALMDRSAITTEDRSRLAQSLTTAEQSLRLGYWDEESGRYMRASQTRLGLGQLWVYLNGAPPLGRVWRITSS